MQNDKFIRLYKAINVLASSVRVEIREDVVSALLDHALSLEDRSVDYIFVSLRNKKIDLLRGQLGKDVIVATEELNEETDGTDCLEDPLSNIPDLGWIYEASFSLTKTEHSIFVAMIKTIKLGKTISVTSLAKTFSISKARAYLVVSEIKEKISEQATESRVKITTIGELYDRLRQRR